MAINDESKVTTEEKVEQRKPTKAAIIDAKGRERWINIDQETGQLVPYDAFSEEIPEDELPLLDENGNRMSKYMEPNRNEQGMIVPPVELKDTIDDMSSDQWSVRFRAEYYQLIYRIITLANMIVQMSQDKNADINLIAILKEQIDAMRQYKLCLETRAHQVGIYAMIGLEKDKYTKY